MKRILKLMGVGAASTFAFALIASSASAQTTTSQPTVASPAPKKPTSATPQMIDEAIQRSQARTARAKATGKPEQWGSEEPFVYNPAVKRFDASKQ